jgi:hypothetical protein
MRRLFFALLMVLSLCCLLGVSSAQEKKIKDKTRPNMIYVCLPGQQQCPNGECMDKHLLCPPPKTQPNPLTPNDLKVR